MFNLVQIRQLAWIALLAMCMLVLAPTVSKFIKASTLERDQTSLRDICSSLSVKGVVFSTNKLDIDSNSLDDNNQQATHSDDCHYCSIHNQVSLPSEIQHNIATPARSMLPLLFLLASRPLYAWTCQSARAPPSPL